jgi:hypothetical protein
VLLSALTQKLTRAPLQDQMRIRYSVRRAIPLDFKTEAHALIKLIDAMQV